MSTCYALILLLATGLALSGCGESHKQSTTPLPSFAQQRGDGIEVIQGDLRMTILPTYAGRISSFKYNNHELVLVLPDLSRVPDWGTVLWSSPESEWGWPPLDTLDNKPYKLEVMDNQLVLTSGIDATIGYQFVKHYQPEGDDAIAVTYEIINHGPKTKNVAALEVTRVPPAGDVFFPRGDTTPYSGIFYLLETQNINELTWYHYDASKIHYDHHKVMLDGKEGWVAYLNKGYLLVKEFEDHLPEEIAKDEREIEVFSHVDHIFVEIKQQGRIETLAPGERLSWKVIWHAKKLPDDLANNPEPELLANYVRSLLQH
jgi:hypothetical protein